MRTMGADPQGFTERRPAQPSLRLYPSQAWLGHIAHLPRTPLPVAKLLPALNGRTPASEKRNADPGRRAHSPHAQGRGDIPDGLVVVGDSQQRKGVLGAEKVHSAAR